MYKYNMQFLKYFVRNLKINIAYLSYIEQLSLLKRNVFECEMYRAFLFYLKIYLSRISIYLHSVHSFVCWSRYLPDMSKMGKFKLH